MSRPSDQRFHQLRNSKCRRQGRKRTVSDGHFSVVSCILSLALSCASLPTPRHSLLRSHHPKLQNSSQRRFLCNISPRLALHEHRRPPLPLLHRPPVHRGNSWPLPTVSNCYFPILPRMSGCGGIFSSKCLTPFENSSSVSSGFTWRHTLAD